MKIFVIEVGKRMIRTSNENCGRVEESQMLGVYGHRSNIEIESMQNVFTAIAISNGARARKDLGRK